MEALFIAIVAAMFIVIVSTVFIYNQILNIKSDLLDILEREKMRGGAGTVADFDALDEDIVI